MNVRRIFALLISCGMYSAFCSDALKNPDFSKGISGWKVLPGTKKAILPQIDEKVSPCAGKCSIRFDLDAGGKAITGQIIKPSNDKLKYKLSLWIKAENVKKSFAYAATESRDKSNKYLGWKTWVNTGFINGSKKWKRYSCEITIPVGARYFWLWLGVKGVKTQLDSNGKVWFADVKLDPVLDRKDRLDTALLQPAENMGIFSLDAAPVMKFDITNSYASDRNIKYKVVVDDFYGNGVYSNAAELNIGALSRHTEKIIIPKVGKTGFYGVNVKVFSGDKLIGNMASSFCIVKPNPAGNDPFFGLSCFTIPGEKEKIRILSDIGVGSVGVLFYWSYVESQKGEFRFQLFDRMIKDYQDAGIDTIGFFFALARKNFAPRWALNQIEEYKKGISADQFPYPQVYFDSLAVFVDKVVNRYKGRINTWSLVQEIDLSMKAFKWEYEYYVKEIKTIYPVIKKVSPKATVGAIGVSGTDCRTSPRFLVAAKLWKELPFLDAMFFNPYMGARMFGSGHSPTSPEDGNLSGILEDAVKLVKKYGKSRIGIHEKGMKVDSSLPPNAPDAKKLAHFLVRSYTIAKACPNVSEYLWFKTWGAYEGKGDYGLWKLDRQNGVLSPRPGIAAFSTVANLLGHTESGKRIKLHKDINIYLFEKKVGKMVVAVMWTTGREPITLSYRNPKSAEIYNMMKNHIKTLKPGMRRIVLTEEPFFLMTNANVSELDKAFERSEYALPLVKGDIQIKSINMLKLNLCNQSGKLSEVEILPASKRSRYGNGSKKIKLPPMGQGSIDFKLANDNKSLINGENVQFIVKAGKSVVNLSSKIEFYPVNHVNEAAADKFARIPAIELNSADYLFPPDAAPNKLWTGPDDLSAECKVAYGSKGLYLQFSVKDDIFFQKNTSVNIWKNDSVQVAIDAGNNSSVFNKTGFDDDDYEFGMALTPKTAQSYCWKAALVNHRYQNGCLPGTFNIKRLNNRMVYECYIPWSRLKPLNSQPGAAFKMSFVINDADKDETAPYCLQLTPGVSGGKKPHLYKTFILMPEKKSFKLKQ